MPRTRARVVEPIEMLTRLVSEYPEPHNQRPLRMLLMLKRDEKMTLRTAADKLGVSERTIRRWWAQYQAEGPLVFCQAKTDRERRLKPSEIEAFRQYALKHGFSELSEAREWILKEFGAEYSVSGVAALLRKMDIHYDSQWGPGAEAPDSTICDGIDYGPLLRFMMQVPEKEDIIETCHSLRSALMEMLPDVDWMMININTSLAPLNSSEYMFVQSESCGKIESFLYHQPGNLSPDTRLLATIKRRNFPVEQYHPMTFIHVTAGDSYCGSFILWRDRSKAPISESTLSTVDQLMPLFRFIFSDIAHRHDRRQPAGVLFRYVLGRLHCSKTLTEQELRVVSYRLLGNSYKEIAELLHISVGTVKKHLHSVYTKTGTKNHVDLFARHLSGSLNADIANRRHNGPSSNNDVA